VNVPDPVLRDDARARALGQSFVSLARASVVVVVVVS
jgi:hypothetical protein